MCRPYPFMPFLTLQRLLSNSDYPNTIPYYNYVSIHDLTTLSPGPYQWLTHGLYQNACIDIITSISTLVNIESIEQYVI